MTGFCKGAQMYVAWPCPARACPHYEKCLKDCEVLARSRKVKS